MGTRAGEGRGWIDSILRKVFRVKFRRHRYVNATRTTVPVEPTCTQTNVGQSRIGVTNLQDFTTAASLTANSEFKHYVACGTHGSHDVNAAGKTVCNDIDSDGTVITASCNGQNDIKLSSIVGTGDDLFQHQFPLMPLASASADQFVIRYEVVYSTKLSSRRRLRATKPFRTGSGMISNRASSDKRLVLAGEKFARGSTNGFKVIGWIIPSEPWDRRAFMHGTMEPTVFRQKKNTRS